MTPQEKAKELVEKYLDTIIHFPYIDTEDGNCIGAGYMTHNSAKQCALIAVDEILGAIKEIFETLDTIEEKKYWQEVKQELCKH
jgi:hypothetical protein